MGYTVPKPSKVVPLPLKYSACNECGRIISNGRFRKKDCPFCGGKNVGQTIKVFD